MSNVGENSTFEVSVDSFDSGWSRGSKQVTIDAVDEFRVDFEPDGTVHLWLVSEDTHLAQLLYDKGNRAWKVEKIHGD